MIVWSDCMLVIPSEHPWPMCWPYTSTRKRTLRILLDHCLPRQLVTLLPGDDVAVAAQMGWHRLDIVDNMLALAQGDLDGTALSGWLRRFVTIP